MAKTSLFFKVIIKSVEFSDEFKKFVLIEAKKIITDIRDTETEEEKIIKQRIAKIQLRMKNAEDDRFDRVITREDFSRVYSRLKEEIETANIDLAKITKDHTQTIHTLDELLAFTDNIHESYINAENDLKRRYLQIFFDRIVVNDGKVIEVKYTPAIEKLMEIDRVRITNNWRRGRDSNPR